jgi:hypothetical protein
MRTTTLVLAGVISVVFVAPVQSAKPSGMLFDKVSVFDGFFVPTSDIPAAFKDINLIQVVNPRQAQSPPFGYLELKTRKSKFSLLKPALDGTTLSFKTRALLGISYEFSGTLPRIEYEKS